VQHVQRIRFQAHMVSDFKTIRAKTHLCFEMACHSPCLLVLHMCQSRSSSGLSMLHDIVYTILRAARLSNLNLALFITGEHACVIHTICPHSHSAKKDKIKSHQRLNLNGRSGYGFDLRPDVGNLPLAVDLAHLPFIIPSDIVVPFRKLALVYKPSC
jgi:hypothetical protein